jgi:hypothetical protein
MKRPMNEPVNGPMHEPEYGATGAGVVLLELGAGIGALILHVPVEMNGAEIDISRAGLPGAPRTHAQVRERPASGGVSYSALYPGLPAGAYTVWRDKVTAAATVAVAGGQIASCAWPPSAGPDAGQRAGLRSAGNSR